MAGVIDKNGVVASAAAGVRADGKSNKMTKNDKVLWASVTKAMTATMLAVLVDEGKFAAGWSTTISVVFPEYKNQIDRGYRGVTLYQLVTNTGGIPREIPH